MNSSDVIMQSPLPIIKVRRLKTKGAAGGILDYDEDTLTAKEVIEGRYGVGEARRKALGARYARIQAIVNAAGGKVENLPKKSVAEENPEYASDFEDVLAFSPTDRKELQSYSFALSTGDVSGGFTLVFFPESGLYESLRVLDVVEIYEANEKNDGALSLGAGQYCKNKTTPVFVGIIKRKKYIAQAADGGVMRRFSVSGISVAGLVSQYRINLDTTAMAISRQIASAEEISKELSISLLKKENPPIKDVIKAVWNSFESVAKQCGTVAIGDIIKETMGGDFFDCDDSVFKYPLANVLRGEATQNFYSLIDGIIPEPIYEKFAYMDFDKGRMRIKIRQAPFRKDGDDDCASDGDGKICWTNIYKRRGRDISALEVKGFDLEQSDDEVYTVFFSYLNGYPINEEKLMRIIANEDDKESQMIKFNEGKYKVYGYRPLIATFNGYAKFENEDDETTNENLAKTNQRLQEWFGRLDDMLKGSITLAMTYDKRPIMPGEVIGFLGGQFYVDGISHSWNYGAGGEINISVSRGGEYDACGGFHKFSNVTDKTLMLEKRKTAGV